MVAIFRPAPRAPDSSGADAPACPVPDPQARLAERRGRVWLVGSWLLCPCHLPLTLWGLAFVFGGTALGATIREHAVVAAAGITVLWLAGTARGFVHLRRAKACGSCRVPAPRA